MVLKEHKASVWPNVGFYLQLLQPQSTTIVPFSAAFSPPWPCAELRKSTMCPLPDLAEVSLGRGLCINTGYINANMILACSQGPRGVLIVWALTLTSTLTYLPHHSLCLPLTPSLCFVSLLPCSPGFLPQSTNTLPLAPLLFLLLPYLQATMEQADGESDGDESHGAVGFFFSGVVAACPGSCSQWQLLELSGSCLPFLRPGWPSSACQPPWWSLADIRCNLLGAVMLAHISHLTSLQCCLLKSWQRLHVLLCIAVGWSSARLLWCWVLLHDQGKDDWGAGCMMLRQIIFPKSCQVSKHEGPYHAQCTPGCTPNSGLRLASGEVLTAENKKNFCSHIRMYWIHNGSVSACTLNVPVIVVVCVCVWSGLWVCLIQTDRERERVRGCVCFHLLHNGEWRHRVLPCHSGSSVGVRETACPSSAPQLAILLFTTLEAPHYITESDTESDGEGVWCQISSATEWTMSRTSAAALKWMTTTIGCAFGIHFTVGWSFMCWTEWRWRALIWCSAGISDWFFLCEIRPVGEESYLFRNSKRAQNIEVDLSAQWCWCCFRCNFYWPGAELQCKYMWSENRRHFVQ